MRRAAMYIGAGLLGLVFLALVLAGAFVARTKQLAKRPIEAPYPDIELSTDPEVLARGEYLVWNVVGCDKCHLPKDQQRRDPADRHPLQGGWKLSVEGLGSMEFPNITPDPVHGIGRYEPREVARALTVGVMPDGTFGMTMAGTIGDMSDDDLQAIVSWLYVQEPVPNDIEPPTMGIVLDIITVWVLGLEVDKLPVADPAPPIGPTVERGAYLARGPSNCVGCHSPRDMSFQLVPDQHFGGCSMAQDVYGDPPGMVTCAPNLTPDPETGYIARWTEEMFVSRMRAGRGVPDSNMPWEAFSGLHEDDLRALYHYFRTLEPVSNDTGPTYRSRDWTPDEP